MEEQIVMEEINTQRPRELIEADLARLEEETVEVEKRYDPVVEKVRQLPESEEEKFNGLMDRLVEAEVDEKEIQEGFSTEQQPLVQEVREAMRQYRGILSRRNTLEGELTPYCKEDLEKLIDDLSRRVDYGAVLKYYDGHEKRTGADILSNAVFDLYQLRKYQYELSQPPADPNERDYNYYNYRHQTLEGYSKNWQEKGFLREASSELPSPPTAESNFEKRDQLLAELKESLNHLNTFNKLIGTYRHTLKFSSVFDVHLSDLRRVLAPDAHWGNSGGFEHFKETGFDPRLIEAAKQHVDAVITDYRVKGYLPAASETLTTRQQAVDSIDHTKLLSDTKVVGLEKREWVDLVVTPDELLEEVKGTIPPDLLRGLTTIGYKEKQDRLGVNAEGAVVETVGEFIPTFNEDGEMTSAEIAVYKAPFVPEGTDKGEKLLRKKQFTDTLWHEFGHNGHHVMTYDEMIAWEQVVTKDKTAVTWYVKDSRAKDERVGKREDFSESFMLFIDNPALLHLISEERFKFMSDFFASRLRTDQKAEFVRNQMIKIMATHQSWQQFGDTNEDIRNIYLSHEKQP